MDSSMLAALDTYCSSGSLTTVQSTPSFTSRTLRHTLAETQDECQIINKGRKSLSGDKTCVQIMLYYRNRTETFNLQFKLEL